MLVRNKQANYAAALTFVSGLLHESQRLENIVSVRINHLAVGDHLIQNEVGTVQIEHDLTITHASHSYIQLAYITKHSVQGFQVAVNELENGHFVLITQSLSQTIRRRH